MKPRRATGKNLGNHVSPMTTNTQGETESKHKHAKKKLQKGSSRPKAVGNVGTRTMREPHALNDYPKPPKPQANTVRVT